MITVRFATGFSIQYNNANLWTRNAEYSDLFYQHDNKKEWVAQVPNSCIIEAVSPCRTYHAGDSEIKQSLDNAAKSVRSLTRKIGKVTR